MKHKQIISILLAVVMLLSVAPVSFAANNSTQENATPVTLGEEISFTAEAGKSYWYSVETTKSGQFIKVESNYNRVYFYDADGNSLDYSSDGDSTEGYVYCTSTNNAGKYSIEVYPSGSAPRDYVITVTLVDNDVYEPNNTEKTAYLLTAGVPVEFQLGYSDIDYFIIETTKAGQDVQIDFSGFNYATEGSFYAYFDGVKIGTIKGNGTYFLHAVNTGKHIIELYGSETAEQFTMTAIVLDGDDNEPNDTLEQATRLPIGTDKNFSMGGKGDEDWFTFESAFDEGESSKIYTLNMLDLNTDYSDWFYYDLYAPDGTLLMDGIEVEIRHNNIIACEQEGLYALCLYRTSATSPRSELRIRVDEGGADPYEPNDTWLTAADVQPEQPIQFILSNTEDADWFKFEVPEAYMTIHLSDVSNVALNLYSAENLEEFGTDESLAGYSRYGYTDYYYQFDTPGTYYLEVYSNLAHISQDLRTLTISLEEATVEEPNNTWKTAIPIYEGVPVEYNLTAWNDSDWFVFDVPEGTKSLYIPDNWESYDHRRCLYREDDFETAGDNAASIWEWNHGGYTLNYPTAGTYYLNCKYSSTNMYEEQSFDQIAVYYLAMESLPAQSVEDAQFIAEGQWIEDVYGGYYALGFLNAGDEIRFYSENVYSISLYDAKETEYAGCGSAYSTIYGWSPVVPSDGEYFIYVEPCTDSNADGSYMPYRLLYDVATRNQTSGELLTVEGTDDIVLAVGETAEINLRLAPYDVKRGGKVSQLFRYNTISHGAIADVLSSQKNGYYVVGKAAGIATVKFYLYNSDGSICKAVNVNIQVVDPTVAQSIIINDVPKELPLSTSVVLQATLVPTGANDSIVWSSSDSKVLYVNDNGKVTAVGDGTATITATASSGVSASVTITVTDAPAKPVVTGLTLDDYDLTLYMGEGDGQLSATVSPADSPVAVGWVSSNLKAATVDQNGKITSVAPGVTVITASAGDYRASCIVTVQAPRVRVNSISFDQTVLEIPLGGESTLRPVFNPVNATVQGLTWVSSDPVVASVSRTGIVRTLTAGETTITATTLDGGKQASIIIRVTAAPQPGDINGDGYVDAADAMITLQVAVGKVELNEAEFEAADVNGDGWVDAADAVRILRYDAGLIDSLEN